MTKFVDVVLASGQGPTFTYLDPSDTLAVGDLVRVPFGNRTLMGLVWEGHDRIPDFETKPVLERLLDSPFVPAHLVDLARWIADYYMCQPGVAAGPIWSCAGKSSFVRLGLGKRKASKSKGAKSGLDLEPETAAIAAPILDAPRQFLLNPRQAEVLS